MRFRSAALIAAFVTVLGLAGARHAHAQASALLVQEAPGWNMVGGPPSTSLAGAEAVYAYRSGAYVPPAAPATSLCEGYWAYFQRPGDLISPNRPSASSAQTCLLRAGWTMIGNPFLSATLLPAGTTAFLWDATTQQYVAVRAIPLGGAVWISSPAAASVTLLAAPGSAPALTVGGLGPSGPYQMHVDQTVLLSLNAFGPNFYLAEADPRFLSLESYAAAGGEPLKQSWHWLATAPGSATIQLTPPCALTTPACALALPPIRINVLP
jgi:hypothetical protein